LQVTVRAFGELITILGSEFTMELPSDARLDDLLSTLVAKTPSMTTGFLGPYHVVEHLTVLVNGRNATTLPHPLLLHEGDVVTLLPPFVGG
jgi:molybdopterin converting factor small subunit